MAIELHPASSIVEDPITSSLDNEIATLQEQIKALKSQRALQASTILSSHNTLATLTSLRDAQTKHPSLSKAAPSKSASNPKSTSLSIEGQSHITPLLSESTRQTTHNLTNLYRTLSTISTFHLTDPDPHAVDAGHILGLRFDICVSNGRFTKPYYIMLNRPFSASEGSGSEDCKSLYRVHRHTFPPCIPLASIAARYLPHGKGVQANGKAGTNEGIKRQDLKSFVRAVRREIVGYHKRLSSIKTLRREFGLDKIASSKGKDREKVIVDITAADAEAKQVRIEWVDGRIGRVAIDEKGFVKKCVVIGEEGRDRVIERRVLEARGGRDSRVEDVGERLKEGIY